MTSERWERIKELFDSAQGMKPEHRAQFLESACQGDEIVRGEVVRLLAASENPDSFLEKPVASLGQSLQPGEILADRYRVVRLLGRGGMGEVFEVWDQVLKEPAALKTLRMELCASPALVRRFQTEIQLARRVTHPNVCRVFDLGIHHYADSSRPDLHFFTMQLLAGETLAARIRRDKGLTAKEAFPLIVQMAEGLEAAHSQGIVHRDFKSANVIVTDGRAVITDFGLAALAEEQGVIEGTGSSGDRIAGTVAYMSPEQMEGGIVTAASDIYSFGIVLFEMATGRVPYQGQHIVQSAVQRVRRPMPALRELAPGLDARWESAIRRCLELEPSNRFRDVADLAALFRQDRWRLPRLYWTRRQWAGLAVKAAIPVTAGGVWLAWSLRPYELKPEAAPWFRKGVENMRDMTSGAARRALEQAIQIDSRYPLSYAYLAAVYYDLDAPERAAQTMLNAVSAAQEVRLSRIDRLRLRAFQFAVNRDFDRAQPLFEQLTEAAPDQDKAGAYLELAWLIFKRENQSEVLPPLQKALKLNPGYPGAKLRLAFALDRRGQRDEAQKLFEEAKSLFEAASDYDGKLEAILIQANSLSRNDRATLAIPLLGSGLDVARSTRDENHEIRFLLGLALAYQRTGKTAQSRAVAEEAVRKATLNRMESVASIGLLDLGNAYSLRGEPGAAEQYFLQGREMASRNRALFSEARSWASLASLHVQYDRPAEAVENARAALKFFRSSGYRRETAQSLLIQGSAQESLCDFDGAEKSYREAGSLEDAISDKEQKGFVHLFLSSVLAKTGRWPEALEEKKTALGYFQGVRGGFRTAFTLISRARLWTEAGRLDSAAKDLAAGEDAIGRLEGEQSQLHARVKLAEAEIAVSQARWQDALRFAKSAEQIHGGIDEDLEAALLQGVAQIRAGSAQPGLALCNRAIQHAGDQGRQYLAALGRLQLAEALYARGHASQNAALAQQAASLAREAAVFFEPRRSWECLWRCHWVAQDEVAARSAFREMRRSWPDDLVQTYKSRADLQSLGLPWPEMG